VAVNENGPSLSRKPEGWKDLTARHADDPEGLKAMIDRAEKQKPRKKAK
jgi:hypothetical protein